MSEDKRRDGQAGDAEKRPILESATTLTGARKRHHPALIWLISVVCIVGLCGAGYWAANEFKPEEVEVEATEAPDYTTQLISRTTDEVASVTVTYDGKTYTILNNGDDGYALEGGEGFSLDQSAASSLIARGSTLTTQATASENCADISEFGLDEPTAVMTVDYTDGTTTTIKLGDKSPLTYYYIMVDGDPNVYTVYSSVATTMMTRYEDLHTVELPATISADAISYIRIERPEAGEPLDMAFADGAEAGEGELLSGLMTTGGALDTTLGMANATSAPEATAQPEAATDAPELTSAPEAATDAPEAATDAPELTSAPEAATDVPEAGGAGRALAAAETATDAPEATASAAPVEEATPEATPSPSPTPTRAPTPVPTETPEDMTVIEVAMREEGDDSLGISAYKLVKPFEYDVDSDALSTLSDNVAAISISEYVGNVSEPDNPYGMDNPIVIVANDTNGAEIRFEIGNDLGDGHTYICVDDTGDVYLTETSQIEFARTLTVAGIVDRFSNIINITKVDSLDVTTPEGSYELKIERVPEVDEEGNPSLDDDGEQIINEVFYFNGEETDEDAFKQLYQEVIGILVNGMTEDYDIPGEATVKVVYHLNVEPGEFTVEYVPYTRDVYAVRRDGHTYFYVNNSTIEGMIQALVDYTA